jgi:hypothetical protein
MAVNITRWIPGTNFKWFDPRDPRFKNKIQLPWDGKLRPELFVEHPFGTHPYVYTIFCIQCGAWSQYWSYNDALAEGWTEKIYQDKTNLIITDTFCSCCTKENLK